MSIVVAFIMAHIGTILGAFTTVGMGLWAIFERKGAQTVKAQAAATVSQSQQQVAQAQTAVSQSNEAVAQSVAADAQMAKQVDESAATLTHEEIQNEVDALRR